MALTATDIESYRLQLQAEHARLSREIDENSKPEDFGSDIESTAMEEEADEGEDFANRLAIAQTLKGRLNEIEGALNRISSNAYGVCKQCGMEISKEILALAPESELCSECKKKAI